MDIFHGTTIVSVRRGRNVALGGDGQVTLGNIVVKASARKVRKLYRDQVLAGFAGATADAFTLFERFEGKLEKHQGHLVRAAIELTKDLQKIMVSRVLICDRDQQMIFLLRAELERTGKVQVKVATTSTEVEMAI